MKKLILNAIIIITSIGGYSQVMVKNIEPGANSSYPSNFYPFKDKLIFSAETNFNGNQLYITDGTTAGTIQLTNFNCVSCPTSNLSSNGAGSIFPYDKGQLSGNFTDIDSLGYFFGVESQQPYSYNTYTISVYKTDGTISGTKKITLTKDTLEIGSRFFKWNNMICAIVYKGIVGSTNTNQKLFVYNPLNQTYYYKNMNLNRYWITMIYNTYSDIGQTPYIYNNSLYFYVGNFNYFGYPQDSSIYAMDFTGNVTFKKKLSIVPGTGAYGINGSNNMITNNKWLFNSTSITTGNEPYFYDFTTNTTGILKDVNPYFNYNSDPIFINYSYFHKTSENLSYFLANNPDDGIELYVTDGTPAGTMLTRNTFPGTAGNNDFNNEPYHYHGDTIFCVKDSIRYYYKNNYYKAYKNASLVNVNGVAKVRAYLSIGTTDIYHAMGISGAAGRIYNTCNPISTYSLSAFNCTSSSAGYTVLFDPASNIDALGHALFLKKDSCYYFVQQNCNNTTLTGYELYKYCNNSIYSGINEITALQNHVSVYPNPSTSQFNFNGLVGDNTIQITDIMGRALLTEKTYTENHTLKLDAAQGIYFYKITDKQNRVQQGKLLVQ